MRRKCGPLTPEMERAIEAMTRAIINKVAHGPISELRNHAGRPEGAHVDLPLGDGFVHLAAIREALKPRLDVEMRKFCLLLNQLEIFADIKRQEGEAGAYSDLDLLLRKRGRDRAA